MSLAAHQLTPAQRRNEMHTLLIAQETRLAMLLEIAAVTTCRKERRAIENAISAARETIAIAKQYCH